MYKKFSDCLKHIISETLSPAILTAGELQTWEIPLFKWKQFKCLQQRSSCIRYAFPLSSLKHHPDRQQSIRTDRLGCSSKQPWVSMPSSLGTQQKSLKFYNLLPSRANRFQRWAIHLYSHARAMLRMSLDIYCLWYQLILMSQCHALFSSILPLKVAVPESCDFWLRSRKPKELTQTNATWSYIKLFMHYIVRNSHMPWVADYQPQINSYSRTAAWC